MNLSLPIALFFAAATTATTGHSSLAGTCRHQQRLGAIRLRLEERVAIRQMVAESIAHVAAASPPRQFAAGMSAGVPHQIDS